MFSRFPQNPSCKDEYRQGNQIDDEGPAAEGGASWHLHVFRLRYETVVDDRQQNPEEGGHDNTDHQSPAPPVSRVPTGTNLPPPQTRNPSQYGKRNCDKIQPHVPRTITHRKNIGNPQHDNPADSSDDSDDEAVEGARWYCWSGVTVIRASPSRIHHRGDRAA